MLRYTTRDESITLRGRRYKPWTAVDVAEEDIPQWELAAARGLAARLDEKTSIRQVEPLAEPEESPPAEPEEAPRPELESPPAQPKRLRRRKKVTDGP